MKNKIDVTNIVKVASWIAVAVGGIMASWASDKQQKEQTEETIKQYISEKTNGES